MTWLTPSLFICVVHLKTLGIRNIWVRPLGTPITSSFEAELLDGRAVGHVGDDRTGQPVGAFC
jgi:hypothetical protein